MPTNTQYSRKKVKIILIGDIDKSMSDSIEIPVEVVANRFLENL